MKTSYSTTFSVFFRKKSSFKYYFTKEPLINPQKERHHKDDAHKSLSKFRSGDLLHFVNDSFESCRIVHCEVGKNLTVDFDTCLVQCAHEL